MQLTEFICHLAGEWAVATERTLGALSSQVTNDGKFFVRLNAGMTPSVATFEKFLAFFRDGDNWPDNRIPQAAVDLLDRLDAIATDASASTGSGDDSSPVEQVVA